MPNSEKLRRRSWMKMLGAGGVAGIAGCIGGDDDDEDPGEILDDDSDDSDDTGDPDAVRSDTFTYAYSGGVGNPHDLHFNPYNPSNYSNMEGFLWAGLSVGLTEDRFGEYEGILLEDWDFPDPPEEGSVVTLTFDTDATWSNGDPITARDYVTQQKLWELLQPTPEADLTVEEYRYVDDETAELVLARDINPNVLAAEVLPGTINAPHSIFEDHLERLQDARDDADEDEIAEAQAELLEMTLDADEVISSGAFKIDRITDTSGELVVHDGHPAVGDDGVNWDNVFLDMEHESQYDGAEGDTYTEALEIIDASRGGPRDESLLPENSTTRPQTNAHAEGFTFQFDDDIWGRTKVRHAFAYLMDRRLVNLDFVVDFGLDLTPEEEEEMADTFIQQQVTGLNNNPAEVWYDDDLLETFREPLNNYSEEDAGYPGAANLALAEQLLEDEGFSKDGDSWYTPDGDLWEVEIPCFPHWETHTESAVGQLQNFGVDATMVVEDGTTFFGRTLPEGDFGVAAGLFACCGDEELHPYHIFSSDLAERVETQPNSGLGMINIPETVEVPWPIGDRSYDGGSEGTREVNILETVNELGSTADGDRERELVEELSWVYNWILPVLPARQYVAIDYMKTDNWKWPAPGSAFDVTHPWWQGDSALQAGYVQAKTQDEPEDEEIWTT